MFQQASLLQKPFDYILVKEQSQLKEVIQAVCRSRAVAIDTETTGLRPYNGARVRIISLRCDKRSYVIDCFSVDPTKLVKKLNKKRLIAHNWAFDSNFLGQYGFDLHKARVRDTMILSALLTAGSELRNGLGPVLRRYFKLDLNKDFQKSDWSAELSPEQLEYAARDTYYLIPLYHKLLKRIDKFGLRKIAALEHKVLRAVMWMMKTGVQVDTDKWKMYYRQAIERRIDADANMRRLVPPRSIGPAWKWSKAADIKAALYRLGVDVRSTSKKKLAMELDGLSGPGADFIRELIVWRKASQIAKSFGPKWLLEVNSAGKVHATPQQCLPATGRFSYASPNLQQVPRGNHRHCFHLDGYQIVKADYSGIELRMMAHVAQDRAMIEAFKNDEDLHKITAQEVLHVAEPTKNDRTLAKALNFGLLYGCGPDALREQLAANWGTILPLEKCAEMKLSWFNKYKGVWRYLEHKKRAVDPVWTSPWGRRRLNMGRVWNEKKKRWDIQFNKNANTPIQGTCADGMKKAIAEVYRRRKEIPGMKMLMVVHDEIVLACPKFYATACAKWLEQIMIDAMQPLLGEVPCAVESKVGQTWGG